MVLFSTSTSLEVTAEIDGLLHVLKREILGHRDDHGAVAVVNELSDGKGFISSSRWKIDRQIVQITRVNICQELFDDAHFHRSSPIHLSSILSVPHDK